MSARRDTAEPEPWEEVLPDATLLELQAEAQAAIAEDEASPDERVGLDAFRRMLGLEPKPAAAA